MWGNGAINAPPYACPHDAWTSLSSYVKDGTFGTVAVPVMMKVGSSYEQGWMDGSLGREPGGLIDNPGGDGNTQQGHFLINAHDDDKEKCVF